MQNRHRQQLNMPSGGLSRLERIARVLTASNGGRLAPSQARRPRGDVDPGGTVPLTRALG